MPQQSISLEQTNRQGYLRLLVWETDDAPLGGTRLLNVAEGEYVDLCHWLSTNYPRAESVRMLGILVDPDCLTVMEAAEAAMGPFER